jgi:hypothetical protein
MDLLPTPEKPEDEDVLKGRLKPKPEASGADARGCTGVLLSAS